MIPVNFMLKKRYLQIFNFEDIFTLNCGGRNSGREELRISPGSLTQSGIEKMILDELNFKVNREVKLKELRFL